MAKKFKRKNPIYIPDPYRHVPHGWHNNPAEAKQKLIEEETRKKRALEKPIENK